MGDVQHSVAEVVLNEICAQFNKNGRKWEEAKDVIEGLDCGAIADVAIRELHRRLADPLAKSKTPS